MRDIQRQAEQLVEDIKLTCIKSTALGDIQYLFLRELIERALCQAQAETWREAKGLASDECHKFFSLTRFCAECEQRAKAAERENAVVEGIEADCNTAAGEP